MEYRIATDSAQEDYRESMKRSAYMEASMDYKNPEDVQRVFRKMYRLSRDVQKMILGVKIKDNLPKALMEKFEVARDHESLAKSLLSDYFLHPLLSLKEVQDFRGEVYLLFMYDGEPLY